MKDNRKKTILLNSLVFLFCIVIIVLYCLVPPKKEEIAKIQTYEVTFDTDGGSEIAPIDIEEGHAIMAPTSPTKEGYIFDGWTLNDTDYNFSEIISGNVILKARWKEVKPDTVVYVVTFDSAGGSHVPSQNVIEKEFAYVPGDPVKEGYRFSDWQLNGIHYDFSSPVLGNITLKAVWEKEEIHDPEENVTYTVRFDLNGGSGTAPSNQQVKKGEKARIPSSPTRSGYIFKGWNTNKNATVSNINNFTIRDNTTFYAIWVKDVKTYTVRINLDGGMASNCSTTQTVTEGGHPTGCISPNKTNYNFNGWSGDGRTYDNINEFVINKDITITARWITKSSYTYTLNYNLNGGSGCSTQTYTGYETSHAFNLCTPRSLDVFKSFDYWSNNGTRVNGTITLTASNNTATLLANYKNKLFTVTCHEGNNGYGNGTGICNSITYSPTVSSGYVAYQNHDISGISLNKSEVTTANIKICTSSTNCTSNIEIVSVIE